MERKGEDTLLAKNITVTTVGPSSIHPSSRTPHGATAGLHRGHSHVTKANVRFKVQIGQLADNRHVACAPGEPHKVMVDAETIRTS
jgi:hypothetical protein